MGAHRTWSLRWTAGLQCADLQFCSVSALVADSSSKLSLPCSFPLVDMILVQGSSHLLTQFATIFSVFFSY